MTSSYKKTKSVNYLQHIVDQQQQQKSLFVAVGW